MTQNRRNIYLLQSDLQALEIEAIKDLCAFHVEHEALCGSSSAVVLIIGILHYYVRRNLCVILRRTRPSWR